MGGGREFDLLRSVREALGDSARGLGDDCALIEIGSEKLAVSTDLMIEGRHFRSGWLTPEELGWRAAGAALSDLAAVAARPLGVLASVALSPELPDHYLPRLMSGMGDAARAVGAELLGGDLTADRKTIIDVTVLGTVAGEPLRRSGAVVGDLLLVTGRLGAPAAALRALDGGISPDARARERFARPEPRIEQALWLRDRGVTSMIDVSDGLAGDAGHLSAASGVAIVIEAEKVPLHPAVTDWREAVSGGEEYELLLTVPRESAAGMISEFEDRFSLPLTQVGEVGEGEGVTVTRRGNAVPDVAGYSHF